MSDTSDSPGSEAASPAPPEGGARKMIDVKGMLRQASTRVSVDQLVQKGKKYISLLSKERIEEMINQAAKNIIDKYRAMAAGIADVPEQQIEAESKAEFNELFDQYKQTQKAKTDLEQSKAALDAEIEEMRKDLEKQKALADGKLGEEAEKALIVGFKEFERELDKQVVKVFEKRKLILQEQDPEGAKELKDVEAAIRPIISRLVSAERERFAMSGGQSRETAMLEKRIEKLYLQIGSLESALKTITQSKVYSNQQINNVLRQLGIAPEDKNAEKKKEMLKVVLMATKEVKSKSKVLEEKGITLVKPEGAREAAAALPPPAAEPPPVPGGPAQEPPPSA
jgi:chromosome segregation ATPase